MIKSSLAKNSAFALISLLLLGMGSCKQGAKEEKAEGSEPGAMAVEATRTDIRLSLAQWSIHRMVLQDGVDPYTFAEKAKAWGFEGLEYVSGLYYKELEAANFSPEAMRNFVEKSKAESEYHGLENLLIMVDGQGDLASGDAQVRKAAAQNHHKWVDAAAALGCHSIRVNLNGSMDPEVWLPASVDGLTQLATYAKDKGINILVENHGGPSSDAGLLAQVMEMVDMDNCGTLPDFGNFCIKRSDGSYYESSCIEEYDKYKGMEELMPYAKGVSAKSHNFDAQGKETDIDFDRMMDIVLEAGFSGFVGVEYEGSELSEEEGILATKRLLEKVLE